MYKRLSILGGIMLYALSCQIPTYADVINLTEDTSLTKTLKEFIGTNNGIEGNSFTLDGNGFAGTSVAPRETLDLSNITLKNFTNSSLVENEGTTNITSAILDNVSITSTGTLNLNSVTLNNNSNIINNVTTATSNALNISGENYFNSGLIDHTDLVNGDIHFSSGTTTVGNQFKIKNYRLILGSTGSSAQAVTLNNSGDIELNHLYITKANINNKGYIKVTNDMTEDYSGACNTVNDGTIEATTSYNISQKSTFKNNSTGKLIIANRIKNAGKLINEGKISGNIVNYNQLRHDTPLITGEITTNIDNITGYIQQRGNDSVDSIINITGGTISSSDKIKNYDGQSGGIVNIIGAVKSLVRLDNYNGKTFVKNGGEVQIVGSETSRIFTTGDITFEDGSTLNLRESTIPAGLQFTPTNLILAENDTLNLKMKDGLTLYTPRNKAKGKFSLTELEISDGTSNNWQLIDDANNSDIYGRTSLNSDLKLIKTVSSVSDVNSVMYNKFTGKISYGIKNSLQEALDEVRDEAMNPNKGSDYFYEMSGEESATGGFSSGRFIIDGSNNGVIKNTSIDINDAGTLVLTNSNIKDTTFSPKGKGQLVIRNSSGQTLNLDNTTINNEARTRGVTFEGNSNINFNGEYNGISPSGTVALELGNATLTRNGNDNHAFWILNSGTLKYALDSYLSNGGMNALTFKGGNLDLRNGQASNIPLYGIDLSKDSNIFLDVDLANSKMDSLNPSQVNANGGKLKIADLNLLSDAKNNSTTISFTKNTVLASNAEYTGNSEVAYSPLYKYDVDYNQSNGNFSFTRGNGVNSFNPSVLAAPVAAQVGSYLEQLNVYAQAFTNMDMYMLLPHEKRQAMKFTNKYAFSQGTGNGGVVTFSPNLFAEQEKGVWFRPFATFEKVGLKNGPSVSNVAYGSLFGGDSGLIELSHGWDMTYSLYAGYTGSHQAYNGVSIYQNGGTFGASGAWYKGNFYTGLTANVGANVGEASSRFGNDNFTMLATGIASKTGYNFELAKGKFVIQPNYLMSYTFVNTFDYTNSQGVRIESNPLNAIQIAPGIKFIGNLKNGWQPYASVQMVWNILDKTEFKANNVSLPDMSVKPYIQYGVGVQKHIGERLTGFGQAMIRNGGRNGVALSFGFRWALGKR